jgi:hypothetical protein
MPTEAHGKRQILPSRRRPDQRHAVKAFGLQPASGRRQALFAYYVATYEALVNAKCVSPALICRMCCPPKQPSHAYWT